MFADDAPRSASARAHTPGHSPMKALEHIRREFAQLAKGGVAPSAANNRAAHLPCNNGKNRYENILALDETRVRLREYRAVNLSSDYINANHIDLDDSLGTRRYVSTQAPLPSTFAAFWLMIWEQDIRAVVMLTRLVEATRTKAHKYWPEAGEMARFGPLTLTLEGDDGGDSLRVRTFSLALDGHEPRRISHFSYTEWPDFGLPQDNSTLIRLIERANACALGHPAPMAIHCSAGVGRSGTFIAIHVLYARMRFYGTADVVNVPECVLQMRRMRLGMVQTEPQYVLIYHVLDALAQKIFGPDAAHDDAESARTVALASLRVGALSSSSLKRKNGYLSRSALLPGGYGTTPPMETSKVHVRSSNGIRSSAPVFSQTESLSESSLDGAMSEG